MEATYSAWNVRTYGGPEMLEPVTRTISDPAPNEILVRVRASAVTRADGMMRAGRPRFARPFLGMRRPRAGLSGTGFAGDIIAVGRSVTRFAPGDAVFGETGMRFGANATHVAVDAEGTVLKKPDALAYEEAAVMCDGPLTSWHFLHEVSRLRTGERILVLAGAGSLGSAAIQIAAAAGAEVWATGSTGSRSLIESLGARAVDYGKEDALDGSRTFDVIFDTIGVSSFAEAKRALSEHGRYLCPVLTLTLLGEVIRTRLSGTRRAHFAAAGMAKPDLLQRHLGRLLRLVEDGRFAPLMDRTYPLADLVEAHRYVEAGHKKGNVVVV